MLRNYMFYLEDIRESCEKIIRFTQNVNFDEFVANEEKLYAIVHLLQIIGEAARSIPPAVRKTKPTLEWNEMIRLRNIVVHEYFHLDEKIIWNVIKEKIPAILGHIQSALSEGESDDRVQ